MKSIYVFLIISLPITFSSCGDKLNNNKAEKLIRESVTFPQTNDVEIEYGLVSYEQDSLPKYYYILEKEGMFKIENLGSGGLFVISNRFRVTPTPEGRKFIVEEDKNPTAQGNTGEFMYNSRFKTCEVEFTKVESIQEIPAYNSAEISYVVERKNFTPFWKYYLGKTKKMPDTIQNRQFAVIKTNEGWQPAKKPKH